MLYIIYFKYDKGVLEFENRLGLTARRHKRVIFRRKKKCKFGYLLRGTCNVENKVQTIDLYG